MKSCYTDANVARKMRQYSVVTIGRAIGVLVLAGVIFFALFDVDFVFCFAWPTDAEIPDPGVEAAYQRCYEAKDREIHARAFGTIDNPEVQKEFITSNRLRAARECRSQFPGKLVTEHEPLRFNLVDVAPRFW